MSLWDNKLSFRSQKTDFRRILEKNRLFKQMSGN